MEIKQVKNDLRRCATGDGKYCLVCMYAKENRGIPGINACGRKLESDALEAIENLEKDLEEKQKHLDNLQKVNEDLEERIAIMTEGGWCPDWHFIKFREPTDEEKEHYKDEYGEYTEGEADNLLMLENAPADGEEVLLWTWCGFTIDTYDDGEFDGAGEIEEGMAWAYLPEPPKEGEA